MAGGTTGWDLFSTLQQQAEYIQYYKSVPPTCCPWDGELLRQGPAAEMGVLYCPWGDFRYPQDYDPESMSGL